MYLWAMSVMSEVMICVMTRYVGLDLRRVDLYDALDEFLNS